MASHQEHLHTDAVQSMYLQIKHHLQGFKFRCYSINTQMILCAKPQE